MNGGESTEFDPLYYYCIILLYTVNERFNDRQCDVQILFVGHKAHCWRSVRYIAAGVNVIVGIHVAIKVQSYTELREPAEPSRTATTKFII